MCAMVGGARYTRKRAQFAFFLETANAYQNIDKEMRVASVNCNDLFTPPVSDPAHAIRLYM